jgi:hypothetical protein
LFGGGEVALEKEGRDGEHAGDVVETVAAVVLRKICGGVEAHAEEILHGVFVFLAIEAAEDDAAGVGAAGIDGVEDAFERGEEGGPGGGRGLFGLGRGHEFVGDVFEHAFPGFAVGAGGDGQGKAVEGEVAFGRAAAVAFVAGLVEEGCDAAVEDELRRRFAEAPPPVGPALVRGAAEDRGEGEQQGNEKEAHGDRLWASGFPRGGKSVGCGDNGRYFA